jgi:hypothetical protein
LAAGAIDRNAELRDRTSKIADEVCCVHTKWPSAASKRAICTLACHEMAACARSAAGAPLAPGDDRRARRAVAAWRAHAVWRAQYQVRHVAFPDPA